jgi:putative endonuclease
VSDYYCYILECSDGTLYTGWTTNPARRLREHNAGRGAQYTRVRRPLRMVYLEAHPTRNSAQQREYQIKRRNRGYKLRLIESLEDEHPLETWKEDHDE